MLVHVVDVDSGNIRSVINAVKAVGHEVRTISSLEEANEALPTAERVILPGVGNFGHFMNQFYSRQLASPILEYIRSGRPIMGICVGLQALFAGSSESRETKGLDYFNGMVTEFSNTEKSVPHMGWNSIQVNSDHKIYGMDRSVQYYFVHTFARIVDPSSVQELFPNWDCILCTYSDETFVAALSRGKQLFTQFHPEKSGAAGLEVIKAFLDQTASGPKFSKASLPNGLSKRVIACLDVRANDRGDIVVTKGDQYDVRERSESSDVRNLGKPVQVAQKYYQQGADEVTFLNITSFRNCPLQDLPMVEILKLTSETVFVPLTIGGGIRDTEDPNTGRIIPALEVAHLYFRSGADKVSIGSDAVFAAEKFYANGQKGDGSSPIETISKGYGAQAVVVSIDPKRVYVNSACDTHNKTIPTVFPGPNGETLVWYQCTVKGGRESRDLGAIELAIAVESLGAGEILLNCIDKDGTNSGFDFELIQSVKDAVKIPVIASSGAGAPEHFNEVFSKTTTDAALGAGMFHRNEYTIGDVKAYLLEHGQNVRRS